MSYVDLVRYNVHQMMRAYPEELAATLEAGASVLYEESYLRNTAKPVLADILWRDLIAQTYSNATDILVVGHLAATVTPSLGRDWFQIEVSRPPYPDRELEKNRAVVGNLPHPFSAEVINGSQAGGDGFLMWSETPQHYLDEVGWEPLNHSVPLEIGYCRPETLIYHIIDYGGFARWPYGSSWIWIFQLSWAEREKHVLSMPRLVASEVGVSAGDAPAIPDDAPVLHGVVRGSYPDPQLQAARQRRPRPVERRAL